MGTQRLRVAIINRGIRYGKPDDPLDDFEPSGAREPGERGGSRMPRQPEEIVYRCLCVRGASREGLPIWAEVLRTDRLDVGAALRVLVEGLTIRAARDYDLAELARCLEDAMALGDASGLTVQETLQFLMNQQLESGAIGAQFLGAECANTLLARDVTLGFTACLLHAYQRWTEE